MTTTSPEDVPQPSPDAINLLEVFRYLAALHDRATAGAPLTALVGPNHDQELAQAKMEAAGRALMEGITTALVGMVPLLEACGAIQRKAEAPVLTPPDRALRLMKSLRPDPRIERPGHNGGLIS